MPSNINTLQNFIGSTALTGVNGNTTPAPKTTTTPAPAASNGQTVSLSSTGDSVAKALKAVSETSDVRLDKVSALQSAISSGTYNVPASEVAGKIIASLLG